MVNRIPTLVTCALGKGAMMLPVYPTSFAWGGRWFRTQRQATSFCRGRQLSDGPNRERCFSPPCAV